MTIQRMTTPAILDVQQMRLSTAGVDGFYWPITREELLAFRDGFLENLCDALRQVPLSDRWGQAIALLLPHLLGEAMSLYRGHALSRRARADQRALILASASVLTNAIWLGRKIPEGILAKQLQQGFPRPAAWRQFARASRELATIRAIPWRSLARGTDGIVTIALGPAIERHARETDERISFIRIEEWFPPLTSGDASSLDPQLPGAWRDLVEAALAFGFTAANEAVPESVRHHIVDWVTSCAYSIDCHLTRLAAQPHLLPAELWRGTGGNIWGRILSAACRQSGGRVTGHDHALGVSLFQTTHDSVVEHIACDRFMMWSEKQVELGRRNLDSRFRVGQAPKLEALPGKVAMPATDPGNYSSGSGRRLLYVGTIYTDDRLTFTPLHPAPVMVDWEMRLIGELLSSGYQVDIKPHPESVFSPPSEITRCGAKVVEGRAEDHFSNYDILLFSECVSTPFFNAIQTRQPMVIADAGLHKWQPEASELLSRRCGFTGGQFGEDNRIAMDWDELRAQIDLAPHRHDQTFVREMLGC